MGKGKPPVIEPGPWNRPLGFKTVDDPRELVEAEAFFVYSVEDNDLHFTLFLECTDGHRLFVAETADAVHVVVAANSRPYLPRWDGVEDASGAPGDPAQGHGMLKQPLGDRPIIDATRDEPAARVEGRVSWDVISRERAAAENRAAARARDGRDLNWHVYATTAPGGNRA